MASDRDPRESMSPSATASGPSSTVPTSITSSWVFRERAVNRSLVMPEFCMTKLVILSCIRWKYSKVWGMPSTRPFIRTGWMVMEALSAIKDRLAATARGTPMEWPPPSTRETVGFFMPATSSARARPASTSPPTVFSSMRRPSILGSSSTATIWGMTCSYLVVLF